MDTNEIPYLPHQVLAEQTHLQLPSRTDWIEPAVEYLKQKAALCGACSADRAVKLVIALHEALSNAIIHGNLEIASNVKERGDDSFLQLLAQRAADPVYAERPVDIVVQFDGRCCRWSITDQGHGFDVPAVLYQAENAEPDALASGRGLLLMRSFMDEVRFEEGGRRIVLSLNQESGAQRRQRPRTAVQLPLQVAPVRPDGSVDWEAACAGVARDLSPEGIGLIQTQLASTDRIVIAIPFGDRSVYVPAEVRHCRALGHGLVELGCRFLPASFLGTADATLAPHEVAVAVEHLVEDFRARQTPQVERRAHPRVPYTQRLEIHIEPSQPPLAGYARDISRGGIAFLTTAAPPREVILQFAAACGERPLRVRTEIIRCTRVQEGFYDVGGRFLSLGTAAASPQPHQG